MEVLLKKKVESLGEAGAVVKVATGYARNYLIPKNLAVVVTAANVKVIEAEKQRALKAATAEKERLSDVAKRLEGASATVAAKANEEGKLFGSISAEDVAKALSTDGLTIAPDTVSFAEEGRSFPLKELGVYLLKVKLTADIEASAKLWVVQE